jgi:hypothetical protein
VWVDWTPGDRILRVNISLRLCYSPHRSTGHLYRCRIGMARQSQPPECKTSPQSSWPWVPLALTRHNTHPGNTVCSPTLHPAGGLDCSTQGHTGSQSTRQYPPDNSIRAGREYWSSQYCFPHNSTPADTPYTQLHQYSDCTIREDNLAGRMSR